MQPSREKKVVGIRDTAATDIPLDNAPRRRRRHLWLAGAAAAMIALIVAAYPAIHRWARSGQAVSAAKLRIATVTRGRFVRDVSVDGKVVAAASPSLYSDVRGTVTFRVKAGDPVSKDEVLAVIDSPELSNRLDQEQSTLRSMETDLERARINARKAALQSQENVDLANVKLEAAQRELKRAEAAWKYHVISEHDYAKAKDALAAARLDYDHALAESKLEREGLNFDVRTEGLKVKRQRLLVDDLRRRVDNLRVRSPVNGVVGNLAVPEKAAVTPNEALLSVVDLSRLDVRIAIPESYADGLNLGLDAQITQGGHHYPGKLVAVSPEVQANQVVGRVRFSDPQPSGLKQNQQVQVRILLDARDNVLMVRRGPFLDSGGGRVAYVVRDGVATRTPITVGASSLSDVEVLGGLREGDRIIISDTSDFDSADTVFVTH